MSNQIASLSSKFEEFKLQDKAPFTQRPICFSRTAYECPCFQARQDFSDGKYLRPLNSHLGKDVGSGLIRAEADLQNQEIDPSNIEMLAAIRALLDLEVPQVECLVLPSAFSKKPSKQVVRKQNLALPPVQDIKNMWDYKFSKASGTSAVLNIHHRVSFLPMRSPRDSWKLLNFLTPALI